MVGSSRGRLLEAMGVTVWRRRGGAVGAAPQADAPESNLPERDPPGQALPGKDLPQGGSPRTVAPPVEEDVAVALPSAGDVATLQSLGAEVAVCRKCSLSETRTNTVFGTGNPDADWMFVGEAPGAEEDRQGLPFVGRAGQLLNAMLAALGLSRDDVYIANVLKCRPPNNRDPLGEEVVRCLPYLRGQIRVVRPRIIVAMGRFAAQALLETHTPIARLRGRVYRYGEFETPLVVSYHPAYLLRSPLDKRKAWDDLKLARRTLDDADA